MEWRSPPGEGVLLRVQRCAVLQAQAHAGGCRRRAAEQKTLLDCCRTSGTTRRTATTKQDLAEQTPNPPSGPPGVNPRGLARLCQPSLPPTSRQSCLLVVPAFLRPSKTGRQGAVTPGEVLILLWYYQITVQVQCCRCCTIDRQMRKAITSSRQCLRIDPNTVTY